jgi:tryptophan synthase alpha chain
MKKLVAYLTTNYPNQNFTLELIENLAPYVDIVELGIPFSDPVADGEIIAKANLLALEQGVTFNSVLNTAEKSKIETFLMGYFNSFYNFGILKLLKELQKRGISGTIIPDLPYEEAKKYQENFNKSQIYNIPFVAPTDSKERIRTILSRENHKFIYLVAYAGITGKSQTEDLNGVIQNIRQVSKSPIYIGFGVNKENAKEKVKNLDGVIVGSEFIKIILRNDLNYSQKMAEIIEIAKEIKGKING